MKKLLIALSLVLCAYTQTKADTVTLVINNGARPGNVILTNHLSVLSNQVATLKSAFGSMSPSGGGVGVDISVTVHGVTWTDYGDISNYKTPIAGPAEISISVKSGYASPTFNSVSGWATFEITPESFPPDKTLILPEGTVGIVHVESSTNLIHWQDEWTHTFSNTNQNRFFRIRADRVIP